MNMQSDRLQSLFSAISHMLGSSRALRAFARISSLILVFVIFHYLYKGFHLFDWGHPAAKLLLFSGFFIFVLVVGNARLTPTSARDDRYYELGALALGVSCLFYSLYSFAPTYLPQIKNGPYVDIGYTTQNSAILLFQKGENPYQSEWINVRDELKPEHRGFHYGPTMLLGYAASAYIPNIGYKVTSLVYLGAAAIFLFLLLYRSSSHLSTYYGRWGLGFFAVGLFLLSERFWYEIFRQGANDIFPVALILGGLFFVQSKQWLTAGILLGLSFSAKFSPAAFLLVLFLRKDITLRFFIGCCLGSLPLVVFLLWDFDSLMQNVFILRFGLNYDSTSLYSILPVALHWVLPMVQLTAVLFFFTKHFYDQSLMLPILKSFTLLLVIIEVTFKELHTNHLIWFYPLFAFFGAYYGANFLKSAASHFAPLRVT